MSRQKREWPKLRTSVLTRWHWEEAKEARLQVFAKKNNWLPRLTQMRSSH